MILFSSFSSPEMYQIDKIIFGGGCHGNERVK